MHHTKYMLLLQEHFDRDLPIPLKCALQGYLDGNPDAAQLAKHIGTVIENSAEFCPPPDYLPRDRQALHTSITERLDRKKRAWAPVVEWVHKWFKNDNTTGQDVLNPRLKKFQVRSRRQGEESFLDRARPKPVESNSTGETLAQLIQRRVVDGGKIVELLQLQATEPADLNDATPRIVEPNAKPIPNGTDVGDGWIWVSTDSRKPEQTCNSSNYSDSDNQLISAAIPVQAISNLIDTMFRDADDEPQNPESVSACWAVGNKPMVETIEAIDPQLIAVQKSTFARLNIIENSRRSGHISSLGRFLIDPISERRIESIISGNHRTVTMRVVTEAESLELQECLSAIENQDGVAGCLVLGYDGIVIVNTLPARYDVDTFSAWALATHISSNKTTENIVRERVRQTVSRTPCGTILLTDFGRGLLVVVSDTSTDSVLPLMHLAKDIKHCLHRREFQRFGDCISA